jgi:hypothetical protein
VEYEIVDFSFLNIKKITSKDTARINIFIAAIILLLLNLGFKFNIYNIEVSLTSTTGQGFVFYVFVNLISVVIYLSKKNINTPETKSIPCAICGATMISSSLKCPNGHTDLNINQKDS